MPSDPALASAEPAPSRRAAVILLAAATLCLLAAGGLMWWRYGAAVFSELALTAFAWCF